MNYGEVRRRVRRRVIGLLGSMPLYNGFDEDDMPKVSKAVREIKAYLRNDDSKVAIDQTFGTVETGSVVTGVKIGRLG